MSRLEIVPFSDEHLDGAARLLAARHERHRAVEPLLPEDVDFRAEIEREWSEDGASGSVALDGDEIIGYLIGRPREDRFGTSLWSFVAGHASRDAELARDLYAAAAVRWVDDGLTKHFVLVPALGELIDPWFRLGFGASLALAMRETGATPVEVSGLTVRDGTPDDIEAAARLERAMWEYMMGGPSFSGVDLPSDQEFVDDWRGTWDDPVHKHFVAERDGRVVGHILLYRRPPDLRVPENSIDLASAATDPAVRGTGVGVALTHHVLAWARDNGIPTMTIDWRMTNLLASRFWPARGFRQTFLRLYRSIP